MFEWATLSFCSWSQPSLRVGGRFDCTHSRPRGWFRRCSFSLLRLCITPGCCPLSPVPDARLTFIARGWDGFKIVGKEAGKAVSVLTSLIMSMPQTWTYSAREACLNSCQPPAQEWARMRSRNGFLLLRRLKEFENGMQPLTNSATGSIFGKIWLFWAKTPVEWQMRAARATRNLALVRVQRSTIAGLGPRDRRAVVMASEVLPRAERLPWLASLTSQDPIEGWIIEWARKQP